MVNGICKTGSEFSQSKKYGATMLMQAKEDLRLRAKKKRGEEKRRRLCKTFIFVTPKNRFHTENSIHSIKFEYFFILATLEREPKKNCIRKSAKNLLYFCLKSYSNYEGCKM